MSIDIEKLLKNESQLLSLTGYTRMEFEELGRYFEKEYTSYIGHYQIDNGKIRTRKHKKQRKNATLPTNLDRLFFVLYYLKLNPLQSQMALQFDIHQSQISRKLNCLLPILERALDLYLIENEVSIEQNPKRIGNKVKDKERILLDVTERPIQRNMDNEQQREDYSGKKKALRKKSSTVVSQRICFVRKSDI